MNDDGTPNELPDEGLPDNEPAVLEISDAMLAPAVPAKRQFEKGMAYLAWTTLVVMLVCAAVFVWEIATGALVDEPSIIAAGALHRDSVAAGEFWRLGSSMFLHGSFDHLMGNLLALYVLGVAAEHALGVKRFLLVYLASGLASGLLSMTIDPRPTVGASGAIFGLIGFLVVFLYRYRHSLVLDDRRIAGILAIWAAYQVLLGFLSPLIANFAHIGGFLGGALLALAVPPRAALGLATDTSPTPTH